MCADLMLGSVRRLAEQARTATDETEVVSLLEEMLAGLDGVTAVTVSAGSDGTGDAAAGLVLPIHDSREVAYTVALAGASVPEDAARALIASASATLTAHRAIREARVDTLTRLLNRSALDAVLTEEISRARQTGSALAALMLDLDDFKAINDLLGHAAGDAVLREVGRGLAATVRACDHVGRIGGDEFVILLPGAPADTVEATAARLRRVVGARAETVAGHPVGTCIGIAEWSPGEPSAELLDRADVALRQAKRTGKGRVVSAPPTAGVPVVHIDEPWPELDDALRLRGLSVLFQPIRNLADDHLVGYEALTRGSGRLARPQDLLAHARAAGRLIELDDVLRAHTFTAAAEAGVSTPLTVFVNIEPETLAALAEEPELFWRYGVPFPSIAEVTERLLFERPGRLLSACDRLRILGWGVALDDVGRDPRALALLPLLAPDVIKLDLRMLGERPPSELAAIVVAVSAEAQHSGARILAEGIETDDHAERALALGATLGQGFHLGRPEPLHIDRTLLEADTPLPRAFRPAAPRGITPYNLVASRSVHHRADTTLLRELQVDLERRALGLGPAATIATALPEARLDPGLPRRFRHLAPDVGFAILLAGDTEHESTGAFLSDTLADDHELGNEWITVVACSQYALTMVARRVRVGATERWNYALSHDHELGIQTAQRLLFELERGAVSPAW